MLLEPPSGPEPLVASEPVVIEDTAAAEADAQEDSVPEPPGDSDTAEPATEAVVDVIAEAGNFFHDVWCYSLVICY